MSDWSSIITPPARRDLEKLDNQVRRRVLDAVGQLLETYPQSTQVVKLQGIDPPRVPTTSRRLARAVPTA